MYSILIGTTPFYLKRLNNLCTIPKALFQRFQIMAALDWLENQGKSSLGEGSTCYTMEQFIDVTRPEALTGWNDDTILKFIEGVKLVDGGVTVRFKAGVTVTTEMPTNS